MADVHDRLYKSAIHVSCRQVPRLDWAHEPPMVTYFEFPQFEVL